MEEAEHYRCRRIYLKPSDNPKYQAHAACEALSGVDGILLAAPYSDEALHIIYCLDDLSFEIVVDLLGELEFEIADSLMMSLRTQLFGYLEDNARDSLHADAADPTAKDDAGENAGIPHPQDEQYWEDYH